MDHKHTEETKAKLRLHRHTDETKEKLQQAAAQQFADPVAKQFHKDQCISRPGSDNPFFGKKHTEETKLKIKAARANQIIIMTEEKRKKISDSNKKTLAQKTLKNNGFIRTPGQKKIRKNISSLVGSYLKKRKQPKTLSALESLPFTIAELTSHLESKFTHGMTWENYGKWHIDHITPDCKFYYNSEQDEGFKMCWSLDNLQPLWAIDNSRKGGK